MTGESTPLALPLLRFAKSACEATTLYQELRQPLLRYLVGLGLSSDDAQDVVQDAFLSLQRRLESVGQHSVRPRGRAMRRKIFPAGCFAWRTTGREIVRPVTTAALQGAARCRE